ncbi:MAG: hypothetical protein JKX85_06560 [Phycisphaeraceae bacterium]|nr:hypothetical protein [Phycisphaeraceae bacterium]
MKMDHAHVEATLLSLGLVAMLAVIDLFIEMADGNPLKTLGYILLFFICYAIGYLVLRILWRR